MAKSKAEKQADLVSTYLAQLSAPISDVILEIRNIILSTSPEISEHIKWNSLAFYYNGEMAPFDPKEYKRDIVVLNVYKKDSILLVFPTGARVHDTTGLLEGSFPDGRKTMGFISKDDVLDKKIGLQTVINLWLLQIEK